MTRIKGQIIYLVYLVVSIIIIFALIELTVRLTFPQIKLSGTSQNLIVDSLYGNTPGIAANEEGTSNGTIKYTNKYNAWKYSTKLSTKRKIRLILGDSVTMGIGIDNDSTFIGILMNKVDSLNFINLSLIGYSSEDYYQVLKYFRNIHKDINLSSVTVFWTLNDLYSNYPGNISPEINTNSFTYSLIDFLRKHSKTYHLIKSLFFDRAQDYFLYDSKFYTKKDTILNKSINYIKKVSDICDSLKVSFKLFLLPYEYQVRNYNNEDIFAAQKIFQSQLNKNNSIEVIDCKEAFENYSTDSKEFYLFGDGIHFSKKGHKKLSSFLLKFNI